MAMEEDVVSDPPEVDDETGPEECEELPTVDEIEDCDPLEVAEVYTITDEVDSTPPAVDEEIKLEVWEMLPILGKVEDPTEDRIELLPDPDPVAEDAAKDELKVGVVVGTVTRQEQAEEIEAGEL